jgi:hypothetical protein
VPVVLVLAGMLSVVDGAKLEEAKTIAAQARASPFRLLALGALGVRVRRGGSQREEDGWSTLGCLLGGGIGSW